MIRMFDYVRYAGCLDRAAKANVALNCDPEKCQRYDKCEGREQVDPFVEEMKSHGVGSVEQEGKMKGVKTCIRCGDEKSLDNFHADSKREHGKKDECKKCVAEYQRDLRARKKAAREAAPDGTAGKPAERGDQAAETFEVQDGLVEVKEMVDQHWHYIEQLLRTHGQNVNIKVIEFHYKSAFVHGFKHGIEFRGLPEIAV